MFEEGHVLSLVELVLGVLIKQTGIDGFWVEPVNQLLQTDESAGQKFAELIQSVNEKIQTLPSIVSVDLE